MAAGLLRSVASKMARVGAAPMHNRLILARGLHGGARLDLGSSLTQPPTCSELWRGSRFVLGAAAASAGLRSLTAKLPRTLPPPHHRLLHDRGLHSRIGSTPPPTSKMDLRATLAKASSGVAYATLLVIVIYVYARLLPAIDRLGDKLESLSREKSNLINILTQTIEAMELLAQGHDKQPVGATGKVVVDNLGQAHCRFKEIEAAISDLEAEIPELKDLQAQITKLKIALELALSKGRV